MNIKNLIINLKKRIVRQRIAKQLTGNLGEVEIQNNKIICYVDREEIEKKRRVNFSLIKSSQIAHSLKEYGLDKKICYIVRNAVFHNGLNFTADDNVQVIFRNCAFYQPINFDASSSEIVFEKNMYYQKEQGHSIKTSFITGCAKTLRFADDYFVNSDSKKVSQYRLFGLDVKAKKFIVVNSLFCSNDVNGYINVEANEILLVNSTLTFPKMYIDSDSLNFVGSTIVAEEAIITENKNSDQVSMTAATQLVYDGKKLVADDKKEYIENENHNALTEVRIKLLQTLRNALKTCELLKKQNNNQNQQKFTDETAEKTLSI